jgi:hypothetical protein
MIGLFSIGIFVIPIAIFSEGYQTRLEDSSNGSNSLEMRPWQSTLRPEQGFRRKVYDMLYSHLLPQQDSYSKCYFFLCIASLFFTFAASVTTTVLSAKRFSPEGCKDASQCVVAGMMTVPLEQASLSSKLYGFDCISTVFFIVEFSLRVIALGWRHPCSLVGACDAVSLLTFVASLSQFRQDCFFPSYTDGVFDNLMVPSRLLRLFMFESYLPSVHVLTNVLVLNITPLKRCGYSLICIWYLFATVLYYFEHDGAAGTDDEMSMGDRYRNVLSSLQYALVHLTGDYPITEYRFPSKVAHFFSIIFGMCVTGTFTGILSAGFARYFKEERNVERSRRIEVLLKKFNVNSPFAGYYSSRARVKTSGRIGQIIKHDSYDDVLTYKVQFSDNEFPGKDWFGKDDVEVLAPAEFSSTSGKDSSDSLPQTQFSLRQGARAYIKEETHNARIFMRVANCALIINLVGTLLDSIPQSDDISTIDYMLEVNEAITGTVFVIEYFIRLLAFENIFHGLVRTFIDLLCLFPTLARAEVQMSRGHWRYEHGGLERIILCCAVLRIVRVLNLPGIRNHRQKISDAIRRVLVNIAGPIVFALTIWMITASLFVWSENTYQSAEQEHMATLPESLYWTSIYLTGEWANVDFSPGAGSRLCIFYCLVGTALTTVPVGMIIEAVGSVIEENTVSNEIDNEKSKEVA